ncbi:MAG: L-threonylcarbamoyladenylate synthase [Chloroflexota bacterium]
MTQILQAEAAGAIEQTAVFLKQGQLIVLPTDTVYGVAANAFDGAAVEQLYVVKKRPLSKPIPVLLADPEALSLVADGIPSLAQQLIARYWPGALSLIVPKKASLPEALSPNAGVAVRIPDCPVARAVIRAAGGAVAATSANLSGEEPALTAVSAYEALGEQVAAVLDNGPSLGTIASTVIDCLGPTPKIIRPGPITEKDLGQCKK